MVAMLPYLGELKQNLQVKFYFLLCIQSTAFPIQTAVECGLNYYYNYSDLNTKNYSSTGEKKSPFHVTSIENGAKPSGILQYRFLTGFWPIGKQAGNEIYGLVFCANY